MEEYPYEERKTPKEATGFWGKLDGFLRRNKAMLGSIYALCMTAALALLVVLNNPTIMASTEGSYGYTGAPTAVNAVLWSFMVVATFLAIAAVVFVVARTRRARRG